MARRAAMEVIVHHFLLYLILCSLLCFDLSFGATKCASTSKNAYTGPSSYESAPVRTPYTADQGYGGVTDDPYEYQDRITEYGQRYPTNDSYGRMSPPYGSPYSQNRQGYNGPDYNRTASYYGSAYNNYGNDNYDSGRNGYYGGPRNYSNSYGGNGYGYNNTGDYNGNYGNQNYGYQPRKNRYNGYSGPPRNSSYSGYPQNTSRFTSRFEYERTPYDGPDNYNQPPMRTNYSASYVPEPAGTAYDSSNYNSNPGYGTSEKMRYPGGDYGYQSGGAPKTYSRGDRDSCPIQTQETKSSHADLPTTSGSAIVSTPIGDFILYCSQAPAKTILAYPLYCSGYGEDGIGKEAVHSVIDRSCYDVRVVDDLTNLLKPKHLAVVLARGEYSAAYQVDYESNTIKLLLCSHVFEYKYLTDLETVALGDAGTLLAFSNNNVDPTAELYDKQAPIYIAKNGELAFCGYAEVYNTLDVTSWKRGLRDEIILIYSARIGASKRSVIYYFELRFLNGKCEVSPYRYQQTTGVAQYRGSRNTECASEPFTIDHCICGVEDLQILTAPSRYRSAHLGVAIANNNEDENSANCVNEERLIPDNDSSKSFCCCPRANQRTFIVEHSPYTKTFDFLRPKPTAFQELFGKQKSVTELSQLQTEKCCPVFQTVSPLGETELYTLEYNYDRELQVYSFINHGLPSYVESSSYGYCDDNDLIISYTLHSFQSDNTIYHIKCNQDGYSSKPDSYKQRAMYQRYPKLGSSYSTQNQSKQYNKTISAAPTTYNRNPYTYGVSNDLVPNVPSGNYGSYGTARLSAADNDYNDSISYDTPKPYRSNDLIKGPGNYTRNSPYYVQPALVQPYVLPVAPYQLPSAVGYVGNGGQPNAYGTAYSSPYQPPSPIYPAPYGYN